MFDFFESIWQWLLVQAPTIFALSVILLSLSFSIVIVLYKRDPRAAAAWVGLVWLAPVIGVIVYLMLGVNRIRRRAKQLTAGKLSQQIKDPLPDVLPYGLERWQGMAELTSELSGWSLATGNEVEPLSPNEAMKGFLTAIESATASIYLNTYIFGNDRAGKPIVKALAAARRRGVDVRVLLDGFGSWYSVPPVTYRLRWGGVRVERFLYSLMPWRMPHVNLRSHRKLLIIDRKLGFVGGMNIRGGYVKKPPNTEDIHFRVRGPVVKHFLHSFAADWQFVTGEYLDDRYDGPSQVGDMACRGISAGPDADFDKRRLTLLAAIARADKTLRIVTPYFVPDPALQTALQLAALRGVKVDILIPAKNNLRVVHWASLHLLFWLVQEGCNIYLTAPPFDHSKLMSVDGEWSMVGSGNWDARSLRLNFEYDMECYSCDFAQRLDGMINKRIADATLLTRDMLERQHILVRLRNATAHLLAPYL